jgi:hypothetical protein
MLAAHTRPQHYVSKSQSIQLQINIWNPTLFLAIIQLQIGMTANAHIKIGSIQKQKTFKYLGSLLTNQNYIQEEIKCRLKGGNSCCYSVQTLLSSRLPSKNLKIKIYKTNNNITRCAIWLRSMVSYIR